MDFTVEMIRVYNRMKDGEACMFLVSSVCATFKNIPKSTLPFIVLTYARRRICIHCLNISLTFLMCILFY